MDENRIVDIEVKLAHQEQLLIELNDALVKQQDSIMTLEQLCASLAERFRESSEAESPASPPNERPPHY